MNENLSDLISSDTMEQEVQDMVELVVQVKELPEEV